MNDYGSPFNAIDTTTHQLERAPTWVARQEISNEFLHLYDIEFATRELSNRMSTEIAARATALYSYTRFQGEKLQVKYPVCKARYEHRLARPRDHIKHWLKTKWNELRYRNQRWNREHAVRCGDESYKCYLPEFPKQLEPKWETFRIADCQSEEKDIELIQESLLAQIALFYKYDLKPQAVLVHPSMAHDLVAAYTMDGRYYQVMATSNGQSTFAGLPVIACPELAQGAMVV